MNGYPGIAIGLIWLIFLTYWLVSSFWAMQVKQGEGSAGVARRVLAGFVGYFLFFRATDPGWAFLSRQFFPDANLSAWSGALITALGVIVAIWARVHIGKYWSATVALKSEHRLIRTGPYAWMRHPIYTGILVALFGTAIAINRYASWLGVAFYVVIFWLKARKEEALLAGEFGTTFDEHRRATGFFLPKMFGGEK